MNLAFLGTPLISALVLESLLKDYSFSYVISQCDKECGRGLKCVNTPVKDLAINNNLKVYQPERLTKGFYNNYLKQINIDLGIVIAYGQYIPSYFIDNCKHGVLNIHFSLLPSYRGSSPVHASILNNDKKTGVSIMRIVKGMDEGPILAQKEIEIDKDINLEDLTLCLAKEGLVLLKECIQNINIVKEIAQDNSKATYTKKINKNDAKFTWDEDAISIHNKVRAFSNWPGIFIKVADKIIKIKKTSYEEKDAKSFSNGEIIRIDKKFGLYIKTGKNVLIIKKLQTIGKKEMDICEFLNGTSLKEGLIL